MADDGARNSDQSAGANASKRAGMGAMIGVAAAALVGGIGGVAVVGPAAAARLAGPPEGEEEPTEEAVSEETYSIENLVLNPAETKGTRFLMATVVARVVGDHAEDAMRERDAEVRDRLMSLLSSKTVDELADVSGRAELKEEIRAVLEELASHHGVRVRAVFLPTFVIQ